MAAAAAAGLSLRLLPSASSSIDTPRTLKSPSTVRMVPATRFGYIRPVLAVPEGLSEKVVESIEAAKETCAENPESGECAAAWDTAEELAAAASHAKDRANNSDPLETYCKDHPETEECRTYDN